MSTESRPRFPWPWLVPSLVLLVGMSAWGATVYPELPETVPQHIGPGGVDAWARKSVGSAFVPVFLYIVTTVLFAGAAFAVARTEPENELPSAARTGAVKRPATRASAVRQARAVLVLNAALGTALLPLCAVQWRTIRTAEVGWWPLPVFLVLFVAGLVPLFVAARRDRVEKRRTTR
ncbi:putative membrane protein [Actinopolyspora lacussalsi]|nr:putative membrane protein [Actinopolyspora lacussalsi]